MKLLLDTHVFLWWVNNDEALSAKARKAITSLANECTLSLASCWEMAIKSSLGKLKLTQSVERFVAEQVALNGFRLLQIDFRHAAAVESLPFHHRDPFDRMLVAQAISEKMTLVTADRALARYGVKCLW